MQISEFSALDYSRSGKGLEQRHRYAAAIACFERAIALEPGNSFFHHLLGHALWRARWLADAEHAIKRSIKLDPIYFGNYHILGSIYSDQGRIGEAIDAYNVALSRAPNSTAIKLDRALTFLLGGNLRTGFREYEVRIEHLADRYPEMPMPRWAGQDTMTKTVIVVAEQGIGDIIQFSRYLPWLAARCKRLIFMGPYELACLFDHWPAHVISQSVVRGVDIPPADFYVPLCSLAMAHNTSVDTVPADPGFFRKPAERTAIWLRAQIPQPKKTTIKIGLCWAGNPVHGRDRDRSIALEHFLAIAADYRVQLYSFQVGQRAGDLELVGAHPLIYDLSPLLTEWDRTAAALTEMDLVITVDSAVAHMAAALGVPTWILLSRSPDWRWMIDLDQSPWYPSARLFRQVTAGDWSGVVRRLIAELDGLVLRPGPARAIAAAD